MIEIGLCIIATLICLIFEPLNIPVSGQEVPNFISITDKKFLLEVARKSIKYRLEGKKFIPTIDEGHPLRNIHLGVFVTLDRKGAVRGCRGTLQATRQDIAKEVSDMAIGAAIGDVRYPPLSAEEIDKYRISITLVKELIPCKSPMEIMRADGVVFLRGEEVGVVLPYEGKDPIIRIQWAYKKAGLKPPNSIFPNDLKNIFILKAERFAEGE